MGLKHNAGGSFVPQRPSEQWDWHLPAARPYQGRGTRYTLPPCPSYCLLPKQRTPHSARLHQWGWHWNISFFFSNQGDYHTRICSQWRFFFTISTFRFYLWPPFVLLGVCMIRTFIWFCRPNPTFYININRVHKWRAGSCEGLHKYTNWSAYTSYCHSYFKFQQEKATPTPSSSWDMAALLPPATISHHHPNTDSRHYCIPRKNWNKFFVILHKYISFERNI